MPAVEIGWRLGREHWGRGCAPEAAREVLAFGCEVGLHGQSVQIMRMTREEWSH